MLLVLVVLSLSSVEFDVSAKSKRSVVFVLFEEASWGTGRGAG